MGLTVCLKFLYIKEYTFILFECGSVHTKLASTSFTLLRPFSFFKQRDRSSRDSRAHGTHSDGGCRYLHTNSKNVTYLQWYQIHILYVLWDILWYNQISTDFSGSAIYEQKGITGFVRAWGKQHCSRDQNWLWRKLPCRLALGWFQICSGNKSIRNIPSQRLICNYELNWLLQQYLTFVHDVFHQDTFPKLHIF